MMEPVIQPPDVRLIWFLGRNATDTKKSIDLTLPKGDIPQYISGLISIPWDGRLYLPYALAILVAIIGFWLGMSGQSSSLLLGMGAASIVLTMILAYRLDIIDREAGAYVRIVPVLLYLPWLIKEIIIANWRVIKACVTADLDINPALVKLKSECQSDLAKVVFANSITLTPGTVTVDIDGDKFLVHALYEEDAGPGAFDEMDRRSRRVGDGGRS